MPKWKFLNVSLHWYWHDTLSRSNFISSRANISHLISSNAILLLHWYHNIQSQFNCINASAIPPRVNSCKGKAEVSFSLSGRLSSKNNSTIPANFISYSCKIFNSSVTTHFLQKTHHSVTSYPRVLLTMFLLVLHVLKTPVFQGFSHYLEVTLSTHFLLM